MFQIKNGRLLIIPLFLIIAYWAGISIKKTWVIETISLDVQQNDIGNFFYIFKGNPKEVDPINIHTSVLNPTIFDAQKYSQMEAAPESEIVQIEGKYTQFQAKSHFGIWSLLPAIVAIILCWVTKEPVTSLFGGILAGALLLGRYDIPDKVFLPSLMSNAAAGVLILYLWLLGGLLGVWSKTGAAKDFAQHYQLIYQIYNAWCFFFCPWRWGMGGAGLLLLFWVAEQKNGAVNLGLPPRLFFKELNQIVSSHRPVGRRQIHHVHRHRHRHRHRHVGVPLAGLH